MKQARGDLWDADASAVAITTNGTIKKNGAGVMGRGCAREAVLRHPGIEDTLGQSLRLHGNHVAKLLDEPHIIAFPVKHNWWEEADPILIMRSLVELYQYANLNELESVAMPRPGCGNGKLDWAHIYHLVKWLDDRFTVYHYG